MLKHKGISVSYLKVVVQLERETLNSLFDTLLIWEKHLTQHDLIDLGCDDEHFG